ncbi:WD repeat and FYVE domain-containing protein 3 isoform X1 [Sapajus apella]|uniref:WD repeat and FYVE domain-containing protein 3 n=1 Tax=Sapajus apella TaxID=9515 RepID=A0A6J3ETJ9_SAPAP|nr:WD repeat and FYVE domain-containing protein 3 isoform X1 [Sapajus apella]XP_032095590.1 WD repeat and FYVE domain-containing protein 3 isoform X1 [Sapajus apella]XP_032095591.1 WD repeat and FYVE domain-containing protein 3 isoform X1 [Sapajus apella]XP_032095599.1 WD repeat and FYVE domain-containing protein 3 isoform X1 [Sapajus apella]
MNMVKRIMGRPRQEECSPQDNALGLMHLRRLFTELCHPPRHMTQKEQEEKLYMMLPVFNRVFGNAPPNTMTEKFSDLLQFTTQVSRLMVTEIRRRASNKSTEKQCALLSPKDFKATIPSEAASRAIVQFLEINQSEEASRGWMLLTTINLLASSGQKTVDCMTTMSVPSTLVKCLYLFFDLPHVPEAVGGAQNELPLAERRGLLQKVFVQILVKLCSFVSPAEELAQKDDLQLLFSAITSWCPPYNLPWRKSAGEVLMTISRHGLSVNVVKYIHEKECLSTCVQNMQQSDDLSPLEIVEMFAGLSCFLKDSSDVSQTLLDDFRIWQGYNFLCDLLLRLEQAKEAESKDALKDLVNLITSLTTYGVNELKPAGITTGAPFLLPGFAVPQPAGKGHSVRNIQAFAVLQNAFLKAKSSFLAQIILDAITNIYMADNANYFILEPQHTLSQFAEKISKLPEVQNKYFEMLEFVVFSLNYIPCKELISVSILLKSSSSYHCSIIAMKTLLKFTRHDYIFKDVFREVGLLEVMVNLLHKYAALLKDPTQALNEQGDSRNNSSVEDQKHLALLVMETLTVLLQGSNTNAGIFREFGGARCAHNIVKYPQCRQHALMTIQQLVLSPNGDDDMGTLLGLMHSAPPTELQLKTDILRALLAVLRESHRSRTVFRKVGGFVYITSLLVAMERSLSCPPKNGWEKVNQNQVFELLHTVFCTLTAAMRYEPANSHFFKTEIQYEKLADAVRFLGCFSDLRKISAMNVFPSNTQPFQRLLEEDVVSMESVSPTLRHCSKLFIYLYKVATDSFDSRAEQIPPCLTSESSLPSPWGTPALSRKRHAYHSVSTPPVYPPKNVADLKLHVTTSSLQSSDAVIIHPGAMLAMLDLLASVGSVTQPEHALDLQLAVANILQSLVHTERNQQVMCEAGLHARLLQRCSAALADEDHSLHPPLQRMFERLASQALEPMVLREFLRLASPLNCGAWDKKLLKQYRVHKPSSLSYEPEMRSSMITSLEGLGTDNVFSLHEDNHYRISKSLVKSAEGSTVPLTRVKCLVSMTTPHDIRLHGSSVTPAFVEFDTSLEGFGCLFLPSLAPHNAPTNNAVTTGLNDGAVVSGIGYGERLFPPPSGLSYSSWFCIEHFSSPPNSHPVRLLTVVRRANSSEQHYVCLAVVLSAKDRSLIVSTKEELLQNYVDDFSEESSFYEILPCCARFRCGELIIEGQWHHLVLVMSKGMLKNSTAALYIDGQLVNTVKLHYVHSTPGGSGSANPPVVSTVYAYIGTPPAQRQIASLVWRLGPTHFLEEVLPSSNVTTIYELGPNYVGSFQAVCMPCKDAKSEGVVPSPVSLVPEEKVSFGLYALSVSSLTVARIRKVYNKLDSKAIAKQLGISSHENATPVKLIHNSAGHLNGSARTIGAALIGYLGVRTFVPKPVATTLQYIGGAAAILGLVAMASDVEGLYAAVKALVCVVKSNPLASKEMERIKGYQLLAMLLKKKRSLLNSHILHLTFSLVGTVDSGHETSIIPNSTAFQDLLCDFEVWLHAPYELHLSLFEHFIELLTESSEASKNAKLMREFQLIPKLLLTLRDMSLSQPTIAAISNVLSFLLQGFPNSNDLLRFGQFISSTLPTFAVCEKFVVMEINNEEKLDTGTEEEFGGLVCANLILLRNRLLDILLKLIYTSKEKTSINLQACEELVKTLGFDWIMMFMEEHLHSTTVTAAMRILVVLLSNQSILIKFKEGLSGGGWLEQTDSVLTNKIGTVLGFNVGRSAGGRSTVREINRDACHFPGFPVLQSFLPKHTNVPALYFLLMALFLQQPVSELPENLQVSVPVISCRSKQGCQFDLDSIWTFIFGVPASSGTVVSSIHNVCTEAVFLLLGMLRSMLNSPWQSEEEGSWLREYPVTLMQFFRYLYHNVPDLASMWMSPDFLCALAATVFPFNIRPYSEMVTDLDDEVGSPAEEFKAFATDTGMNRSQSEYCNVGTKTYLTNHPAKKFVFDFMRVLIIDNLCLTPASKQTPLIDLLLEASPERSTRTQQKEFQTYILDSVMDHLLAADVLLGEDASLPITSGGSYQVLVNNVFYFTQRVVDKLWQGMFNKESKLLIDFIIQLIAQSKRRSQGLSLDAVYHCLNRTILYQFSRAHKTVPQQVALLDSLRVLTVNRNLILGPGNHDQEFISCLAHCLINLHVGSNVDGFGLEAEARMTTWHIMIPSDIEPDGSYSQDISEGRQLLIKAVNRVWTELIHSKKQVLEELFKVTLPVNERGHVDIAIARPLIEEAGLKCWQNHLAHEKKCISRGEALVPTTQSKLSRVSSGFGLSKLTGSRRNRKESGLNKHSLSTQEISQWMFTHIAVVRDLVDTQYKEYQERQQNALKYVTEEWCQIECELLRERGLWGPPIGSHLDKWMLEMTEGPCRMRKKMVRNDMFYNHYPYMPETEQETNVASEIPSKQPETPDDIPQKKPARYRRAVSYDSKEYYMRLASGNPAIVQDTIVESSEGEAAQQEPEHGEDTIAKVKGLVKPPLKRSRSAPDGGDEENQEQLQDQIAEGSSIEEEEKTDNATLLRLLEEGEKIQHMYRCARVQGLDTSEGLLLFGKEHFYVIDGFTMTATREIRDIETLPPNMHEPIIPRGARQGPSQLKRTCSIFAYEDIKEVHKRRYLLQPIAVEVFSGDGRNYLLAFQKGIRNKVYQRFLAVVPSLTDSSESVSGQRPNTSVEQGSGLLSTLVGEKSVTQRWERGEISNFQYLMHLNTLAGRSYNDLMQYPVFPWILADYDSEEVDLTNPKTFRNLAKPMGAQTDERLAQYKKRFKDWEDPNGETPAYHYGTHYSSAMIVASYLVRMEPFTQIFLRLQGGHFDLADRMFHSVREAWYSASKHNMADVKELIPEFFYLPEFLFNSNNFDLGCKQNGTKLGDVILPPWAKGDPREFIRVHREALECDYVSAHLHEWIDLIFGYKQQGPAAVEAVNVFHHLFYEGQVDIYNINDPLKETATIGFINNFGQIPKQLFKKPHPPKRVRSRLNGDNAGISVLPGSTSDKIFFHHLDNLRPSLTPVKELKEPVGQIVCTDKGILAVEQNKVLIPPAWNKTFAWGYADLSCRLGTYESDKAVTVYECLSEWGQILCAICPNPKLVITGGTSTVVCVWEMGTSKEKAKTLTLKQALLGHTDTVTCATASLAYHIIVSGSRDRTCIIWDLNKLSFLTQLRGHRAPVSALCINELTGDIVSCAGTYIHVWSINGNPIVSVNTFTGRSQQIICCCVSEMNEWDTQNVIVTGHSDGVVRFWRMEFLQVPETPAPEPAEVLEMQEDCPEAQIGQEAQDEDSSDSEADEQSVSQDPKDTPSQPSSTSHRPRAASCRATAAWCTDSGSDDSRRWSDQLSLDEKDGFIFVNYSEGQTRAHLQGPLSHPHPNPIEVRNYSRLKPGYRWERQLVFRSKLTMHTAFDRKDNAHPAEVTALGVSKDHSRILVGDSRGRVFSWSVSDQPGRSAADHWVKDEGGDSCSGCAVRFSLTERRHHCRNCGQLFCQKCSRFQSEIKRLKISSPVRVCQNCYYNLQHERGSEDGPRNC